MGENSRCQYIKPAQNDTSSTPDSLAETFPPVIYVNVGCSFLQSREAIRESRYYLENGLRMLSPQRKKCLLVLRALVNVCNSPSFHLLTALDAAKQV